MIAFTIVDHALVLDASGTERRVIADLVGQLDTMLADRAALATESGAATPPKLPDDPALARLLPDMVVDDADAALELRGLVEPSLLALKRDQAGLVLGSLEHPGALDADTEEAWARVLTDLRLTIAARLGIEREDVPRPSVTESEATLREVSEWLGGVLEHLIDALDRRDDGREPS